ncbi:MAG: peptide chain release factor 2 [Calditrichaeota bacterium]|nr:peptide chain release factor 2 [Calditrichota bacterium]MCB9365724.1 peptide chain release factor 2 [Calditrichota bacterium]
MEKLETLSGGAGFWDDQEQAQKVLRQISEHKSWVEAFKKVESALGDLDALRELAIEAPEDFGADDIASEAQKFTQLFDELETRAMLKDPNDSKSAIIHIHPGAGGTESSDWASMLYRMYLRWTEARGWKVDVLDFEPAEEAGIKSAVIEVQGEFAYGYCKAESGVHRLVRISPFDANARRHTSFASVFVYPEVDEVPEIEIRPEDLRIDTYRASGAGGQHVNRTESAIRITHLPTNIVVTCQTDRSQHRNRESAMKVLTARLYQRWLDEEKAKNASIESSKTDIAWGHQIRSYVFQPYQMVKDHRTGVETSSIQKVMDGELDEFVRAFLLLGAQGKYARSRQQAGGDEDDL